MRRLISSLSPDDHIPKSMCSFALPNVLGTQTGWTLLHVFAWEGKPEAVELLCRNEADVNALDCTIYTDVHNTPLHIAAWSGHVEVIKILLDFKADTSLKNAVMNNQEGSKAIDLAPKALKGLIEELLQKSSLSVFVEDERNSSTEHLLNLPSSMTDRVVKIKGGKTPGTKIVPLGQKPVV